MNRTALTLLATTAALAATSARADTRISFGLNLGIPAYPVAAPAVVCTPPPAVVYAPVAAPGGYWKEVVFKTWVPERWVSSRDRWGRTVRFCEPGYYSYRTDRVWVATESHHHGHEYNRYAWNR